MKFRPNEMYSPALAPEPTIWALRKNPRGHSAEDAAEADSDENLYKHLFGYDPISLIRKKTANTQDAGPTSAANPNLNIINPETNFALMEIAADFPNNEK